MTLSFMRAAKVLFSSESVTEGHPDKLCDQVSDAVLDALLAKDPMSRVACETATTTGTVLVAGEITTTAYADVIGIVRDVVKDIGYTNAHYGFDYETCGVLTAIKPQSPDIARGVDRAQDDGGLELRLRAADDRKKAKQSSTEDHNSRAYRTARYNDNTIE